MQEKFKPDKAKMGDHATALILVKKARKYRNKKLFSCCSGLQPTVPASGVLLHGVPFIYVYCSNANLCSNTDKVRRRGTPAGGSFRI